MKVFKFPTEEDLIGMEQTELTAAATAGSSVTLALKSNHGLTDNDFVMIKRVGDDQAHIAQLNATVSGNTDIQIDTLRYDLAIGDIIRKITHNQRKFYGCATEDGTYVHISADDSPKTIEVDNLDGTLFEYTGDEGYLYFKSTYFNSQSPTKETDIDDAVSVLGGESDRYCSIYDIKAEAGLIDNPYISGVRLENLRVRAEGEVKASLFKKYALPLSEIPVIIKTATKLMAAGWLLYQEYGAEADGTSKDGIDKVKQGRSILKQIRNGTVILLNSDDEVLEASSSGSKLDSFPDNTTEDQDDDKIFKITDKY